MIRRSAVLLLLTICAACGGSDSGPTAPTPTPIPFTITDVRVGTGTEATAGRRLTVNYTGWLHSTTAADNKGQQFDTSVGRGPFSFTLGANQVIRGWDQGFAGMRVGGLRRLAIPPELGYGAAGNGPIPPNANLLFEVELLDVQ